MQISGLAGNSRYAQLVVEHEAEGACMTLQCHGVIEVVHCSSEVFSRSVEQNSDVWVIQRVKASSYPGAGADLSVCGGMSSSNLVKMRNM